MSKIALILFQTYNNIPPPRLLRSNLNGVLKPFVYNCASEKEWSSLIWFQKSLIYPTSVSIGFIISKLYLIELMLIWPNTIFCGWFDQRNFSMDLTDSLQSLLELLRLKFQFAFIECLKLDVSKMLLSFCFSSLLEIALHQNLWILDIKFSADVIVPFTFRCRPSRCRCDSLMLSCKILYVLLFSKYLCSFVVRWKLF